MSRKKAAPLADETTPVPAPAPSTHVLTPEQRDTLALSADDVAGRPCGATKGDKSCTLALGHAGHHHHVPSSDTIDAIVSWA